MPVPEQTPYIEYTADGNTTHFPLTFDCSNQDHLIVKVNDSEAEVGSWLLDSNANIVFLLPPSMDSIVSIERNTPLERTRNYKTNDNSFRPTPVNHDFDNIWRKLQELKFSDWSLLQKLFNEINARVDGDKENRVLIMREIHNRINGDKNTYAKLQKYIDEIFKTIINGVDLKGLTDGLVLAWSGQTQNVENKAFLTTVESYEELENLTAIQGRVAFLKSQKTSGIFVYDASSVDLPNNVTVVKSNSEGNWLRKFNTPKIEWFNFFGDGINDDTRNFELLEKYSSNELIDLKYKNYLVTRAFTGNRYVNGYFNINGSKIVTTLLQDVQYYDEPQEKDGAGQGYLKIGTNSLNSVQSGYVSDTVAIGRDTLKNTKWSYMNIGIGSGVMQKNNVGAANIGIGTWALTNVRGVKYQIRNMEGSRNVAIGSLALHFLDTGYCNISIGRDSMHSTTTGTNNVALGYRALMSAQAPIGLSGDIENQVVRNGGENVAIGSSSGQGINGNFNTFLGCHSAYYLKSSYGNTFIGSRAGFNLDINVSHNNKRYLTPNTPNSTYVQNGNTITVTSANHGISSGSYTFVTFKSGLIKEKYTSELQWLKVETVSQNTFTVTSPISLETSGDCLLGQYESAETVIPTSGNVGIGRLVFGDATEIGSSNVAIGLSAGNSATRSYDFNVTVGASSGVNLQSGYNNTFLGRSAGALAVDGSLLTNVTNSICVGANSRVSGDNQLQLGMSTVTTYAYGTVQNRSDHRDKTDIVDMPDVMTQFLLGLRAVQGKWDMREDYVLEMFPMPTELSDDATDEEKIAYQQQIDERNQKVKEWWSNPVKNGDHKRKRNHNWFVAQEVKALADQLEIDFAGFQDHSKTLDGTDTLSVGYDEFVPVITHVLQKAWSRLDGIESRLEILEGKA